ncbi:MAG: LptA/OstA family protein [Spirochaetota bacterium]
MVRYGSVIAFIIAAALAFAEPEVTRRSGDTMTFSNPEQTVTYEGNAKFIDGSNRILSDYMKFYLNDNRAFCQGNVRIFLSTNVLITAGRADYSEVTKSARVTQRPVLFMKSENITVKGDEMQRRFDNEITTATGNVSIERIDPTAGERVLGYGSMLRYDGARALATLAGAPRIVRKGATLTGERMEYSTERESIEAFGRAAIIFDPADEAGTNRENTITADRIQYLSAAGTNMVYGFGAIAVSVPRNDMVITGGFTVYDIANKFARMLNDPVCRFVTRETSVTADVIEYSFVTGKEVIDFLDKVVLVDNTGGMMMNAGHMRVFSKDGYTRIMKSPIAYLVREKIVVTAIYFEQFAGKNKLRANGDVIVRRDDVHAYADIAVYDMKSAKIKLWGGTPRMVQKERTIHAREIVMNVKSGTVELVDPEGALQ